MIRITKFIVGIEWWVYIILSVLITLATLLVRERNNSSRLIGIIDINIKNSQEKYSALLDNVNVIVWNQWQLEGKKIKSGLKVNDLDNNRVSLDSLIKTKKGKVLILRFFKTSCEDCQIQEMKMIQEVINPNHVLIVASFDSVKALKVYLRSQNISLPAYNLESTEIMLEEIDKRLDRVYSFITDSSYTLTSVHLGKGMLPELSETYYKLMAEKLNFKKND